jgi:hypothetical protein
MKKVMKAVAAIMLMTAVVFTAGCTKPDEPNGGNGGNHNGHEYVDLGLPSGTLWATCNVGATTPEAYGDYFAWGETQPKTIYNWSTYRHCNGDFDQLTKYCYNSSFGYNGFTDNLTTLLPEDDAATANWGNGWCMPTVDQWNELRNNTTNTWTTRNGVDGMLFTASNGNSLFLPAEGYLWNDELDGVGGGYYWSSSFGNSNNPDYPQCFYFNSGYYNLTAYGRPTGHSVRAVYTPDSGEGSLNGTTWRLDNPHDEHYALTGGDIRVIYTLTFGDGKTVTYTWEPMWEEEDYYDKFVMTGTYTYANGSGVAMIHFEGEDTDYRITFTVSGDTLTWHINARDLILHKQ